MEEKISNKKMFGFVIELNQANYEDKTPRAQVINQGVPVEIVIMQMRAFLAKAEKEYFDEFNYMPDNNS